MSSEGPLKDPENREKAKQVIRDMDESSPTEAGPGAPETVEPRTGRPGAGGHGPDGPGGPAPETMAEGDES